MTEFDEELERRIALLENPDEDESVLDDLPWRDVAYAAIGLLVLSVLLLVWGYGR